MLNVRELESANWVLIFEVKLLCDDLKLLDVVSKVGLCVQAFSEDS